jgi:dynein heavy chain
LERLQDLLDIVMYVDDFSNIDKIEIGGVKGELLTVMVQQVHREFTEVQQKIQTVDYDYLDLSNRHFERDFFNFCSSIKDFDKRLCYVISKGFNQCTTAASAFKILETFATQMRRDMIRLEVETKYIQLLNLYSRDLNSVHEIFTRNKDSPPVLSNLPRISGALAWCNALMQRISWPMQKLSKLTNMLVVIKANEMDSVKKKYVFLIKRMREFEEGLYKQWVDEVEHSTLSKLNNTLFKRLSDQRIIVNFDSALSSCIQEVKYLNQFKMNVPENAENIYTTKDRFRYLIGHMEYMARQYNTIVQTVTEFERPLIQDQLSLVDMKIEQAITTMNWKSDSIQTFIEEARTTVKDMYDRINFLKGNVKTLEKMIASWMNLTQIVITGSSASGKNKEKEREETKIVTTKLSNFVAFWRHKSGSNIDDSSQQCLTNLVYTQWKNKTSTTISRVTDVITQGVNIHRIVALSSDKIQADVNSAPWKNYLGFLNNLVSRGLYDAIRSCLQFLIGSMSYVQLVNEMGEPTSESAANSIQSSGKTVTVLIEAKLELLGNDAVYTPGVNAQSSNSIQERVQKWISTIFSLSGQLHRVDDPLKTLEQYINGSTELQDLRTRVKNLVDLTVHRMKELRQNYIKFSFLWMENPQDYLQRFVKGHIEDNDGFQDDQTFDEEDNDAIKPDETLSLNEFEIQIVKYEKYLEQIREIPDTTNFGWLTVDASSIRQAVANMAAKWRLTFLDYLMKKVKGSLDDFDHFVEKMKVGLKQEVAKDDYEKLKEMMGYLLEIKERPENTKGEAHFEPLKEMVHLLKKYDIKVPQEVMTALDDAKNKWKDLLKLYYEVKDKLSVLQGEEIKKITKSETNFNDEANEFREEFTAMAPFDYQIGVEKSYDIIDRVHLKVNVIEDELKELRAKQKLFGLMQNQGKAVKECRTELKLLKRIWDLAAMVRWQIEDWKNVPFLLIDYDEIQEQTKRFKQELNSLDKRVKRWDAFNGLSQDVNNFVVTLPLIQKLRNPGMRKRHWEMLMQKANVIFELSENFRLENLLALHLHNYVEAVEEIVDRAVKEMKMEKQISDLKEIWSGLSFAFQKHRDDDEVQLVKIPEEVIENMEDHQVQLQTSSAQRFVDYFINEIEEWQSKLGKVDTIITLLSDVQRKWLYLETIFIGSDDIREQLPEDSKRFDSVDHEFKIILETARTIKNIVEFSSSDGLEEHLTFLQEQLDLCENKLTAYLEEKKKAFPRFYFTAVTDLLDILSKGGQSPHNVMKHMGKLFQAINTLKFKEDGDGNKTNEAIGVISREGEYIKLKEPCLLQGKVEVWLNKLEQAIKTSLRHILSKAMHTYEEKPREKWLLDYPSQIVLVACQIYWTQEVNVAFEQLEENNENAMKDYNKKQMDQLTNLIQMVQQPLNAEDRQKIMNLVTIDVHARDVVDRLIQERVQSAQSFEWQSQLRQRWDEAHQDTIIEICDATFKYGYEYLGNGPRLVITPLTDRIYITLTQSLHLIMGGAPAGPAGTGKTETTKDLGAQLGKPVYVFNCSDQMDNTTLGDIFKGLASSGSWGCFDEFNRIAVEVLSVVSTQFKSVLNAIKGNKARFMFEKDEISLDPTCGVFITMNPGYLGRTELPESLKALFRPVTVVVPDLELICENMLMAEGFINARPLAKKFITLYSLNNDLLSKQDHYDWGLRAIKSVLVVAGTLKRAEPNVPEDHILMRALRDFNLPKIVVDDLEVFTGLIEDLFPGIDPPRKVDEQFEVMIAHEIKEAGWQAEENLVLKVVQLAELLFVRHSVFIIGPAGAGKTVAWKSLQMAMTKRDPQNRVTVRDLNPKAITSHELYGHFSDANGEWHDGLLSNIMRELANMEDTKPKWIILDGDLDTEWIESMNSVMDDNRILTLANNDRIPLKYHMKLIFEISHLKYATPATVSRAGILFISEKDIGWNPYVTSWIDKRPNTERAHMLILVDKYIPESLRYIRREFKHIIPIADFAMVQSLCYLLDGLLTPENVPTGTEKDVYEAYFVFAAIWAFGGALQENEKKTAKIQFDKWWRNAWKTVKFPEEGTVFDYYYNPKQGKFISWKEKIQPFVFSPEIPLSDVMVSTEETACVQYFMDLLVQNGKPFLLVGNAGTGKTKLIQQRLHSMDTNLMTSTTINFNYYTDSMTLQNIMEANLEKKGGNRKIGPSGNKTMIFFIDDLNMPAVDQYGTQTPIQLLRQHIDYGHWYDRQKLTLKEVVKVQYVACMNPTAGSFTVNPRLQRHFVTLAVNFPNRSSLMNIYLSILQGHTARFAKEIQDIAPNIVKNALDLHDKVVGTFTKTASNFHYEFNLRQLTSVFEGLLRSGPENFKISLKLVRLWIHESLRVYSDRLTTDKDAKDFRTLVTQVAKTDFQEVLEEANKEPILFSHFAHGFGSGEHIYDEFSSIEHASRVLNDALAEYNKSMAVMNLVLFEDAISHICRISRIIQGPNGNALLVGVGGSGKQSLSRLAAFISELQVTQITITRGYNVENLKEDLRGMYRRTGIRNQGTVFLFTDTQIVNERFLVYINDLLSSGNIPDLFTKDEAIEIANSLRTEAKSSGIVDVSAENCWRYFIQKVRRNLHVILCFSPVGNNFRVRARKFPALVNCTAIDWFFPWPREALLRVASRFLAEEKIGDDQQRELITQFMAFAHEKVNDVGEKFREVQKRFSYTTPKSYLELIKLYKFMLQDKRKGIRVKKSRLEMGIEKLKQTTVNVAKLEKQLQEQRIAVEEKKKDAEIKLDTVSASRKSIEEQNRKAQEEERKATQIKEVVEERRTQCNNELKRAEPIVENAKEALQTLNVKELTELRSLKAPASGIQLVFAAVLVLLSPKSGVSRDVSWSAAQKKMAAGAEKFLKILENYDKENIMPAVLQDIEAKYLSKKEEFNYDVIFTKSRACAGLCKWVINVVAYYKIHCEVQPLREKLVEAEAQLSEAQEKLNKVRRRVDKLNKALKKLEAEFQEANQKKLDVIAEQKRTEMKLELAQRFVKALASENVRWTEGIKKLEVQDSFLIGDVLLAAAFVSYAGSYDINFRRELTEEWIKFLNDNQIPMSPNLNAVSLLSDDAEIAKWSNNKLPTDQTSIENGCILTNCERWPLMIDPQLQGITWIKNQYGKNLHTVRLDNKKIIEIMEKAIQAGDTVLVENIGETIDATLAPILGRNVIMRSGSKVIKLENEVEYNDNFMLIFHTKLSNPHYNPEIQAETTLINFTVTESGLEDQLLALVVQKEREDLEERRAELSMKQNKFKIDLKQLEDTLLENLNNSGDNVIENVDLIENLEQSKEMSDKIKVQVAESEETEKEINLAREDYRQVAARGSILYFLLDQLRTIQNMYQFSLSSFVVVFNRAIQATEKSTDLTTRINSLIDTITYQVFIYTDRGLFERHKLIFSTALCLKMQESELDPQLLDFLIRGSQLIESSEANPFDDWMSDETWLSVNALVKIGKGFERLIDDIKGSSKRWKSWSMSEAPERVAFPQDWKNKSDFQKLLVMRALRPDRLTQAVRSYVGEKLDKRFIAPNPFQLDQVFAESRPSTPLFFILFPGADPIRDIESLGKKLGFSEENDKFANISLGKGQESIAEEALEKAYKVGGWVVLQNIHLMQKWLPRLERQLELLSEGSHKDFRVFLSAEPGSNPIPQSILQVSIKITNEPPENLKANMLRAFANFTPERLESSIKQNEFKTLLFTLCFFHSLVLGRRKFGFQGWSRSYSFNTGDLTISADVLYNYLESNDAIPWADLRYIFGEIMYGGHITDKWDRRTCSTYLETLMREALFEDMELSPKFIVPPAGSYQEYEEYIENNLPDESPVMFGLHPNAEIDFLTNESENLFRAITALRARTSSGAAGLSESREARISNRITELLEMVDSKGFDMVDISGRADKKNPYMCVVLQECERMNILLTEIKVSLRELKRGLNGELTISEQMDQLLNAMDMDRVPMSWTKIAYPSLRTLPFWFKDLMRRIEQLEEWSSELVLPKTVWISGLFNPMSFLTAVMQTTARKTGAPLDKMCLQTEVLKKYKGDITAHPRDGCYIHGLYLEGAGWDLKTGVLCDSELKELSVEMPVIHVKAVPLDKRDLKNVYECPVYITSQRGPTYIFTAQLKTKHEISKWVLAGVALLLQPK